MRVRGQKPPREAGAWDKIPEAQHFRLYVSQCLSSIMHVLNFMLGRSPEKTGWCRPVCRSSEFAAGHVGYEL